MHIRPYAPGDELALLAIFQSAVRGLAIRNYTFRQIEAWAPAVTDDDARLAWTARIQANRPWIAEVDGRIAAFADLQPSGYIDQFFVAAEFAGHGIGGALMRHLHRIAVAQGIPELSAHVSLTAQPFFAHAGFVVEAEQEVVVRGVALRNAVMRKTLV